MRLPLRRSHPAPSRGSLPVLLWGAGALAPAVLAIPLGAAIAPAVRADDDAPAASGGEPPDERRGLTVRRLLVPAGSGSAGPTAPAGQPAPAALPAPPPAPPAPLPAAAPPATPSAAAPAADPLSGTDAELEAWLAGGTTSSPGGPDQEAEPSFYDTWLGWLEGSARYRLDLYSDEGRQDNDRWRNQLGVEVGGRIPLEAVLEGLSATARLTAVTDDESLSRGFFDDRGPRRPILNASEAFVAYETPTLVLRAGKQVLPWGKADIVNPTDLLNARDHVDLLDYEEIGNPALYASALVYEPLDLAVEGVWLPLFVPTRIPPRRARYDLARPDLPFAILRPDRPPHTFATGQYGGRVRATARDLGLELEAVAYHGWDHSPNLRLLIRGGRPALEPFYKRRTMLGGSLAWTVGPIQLHGEAGQFFHHQSDESDYLQYVVGVNLRRQNLFDASDELFVVLEYAGLEPTDRSDTRVFPSILSQIFRSAALARVRYSLGGGDLVLEATAALLMYQGDSQYYQATASYRVTEWLKATVGVDVLAGDRDGFFGQFDDDDRLFIELEASF